MNKLLINYRYAMCEYCAKIVKLNKFIFGSLHICETEETRRRMDEGEIIGKLHEEYWQNSAKKLLFERLNIDRLMRSSSQQEYMESFKGEIK